MKTKITCLIGFFLAVTTVFGQHFNYSVYTDSIKHTMRGGIGASWHVINDIGPLNNQEYQYPVREDNPLGSAWGGNPPVSEKAAWEQICNHAKWLGLDFIRLELAQKSYQPLKDKYTWDSDDMKALYTILDYCEKNQVDVFLQQMTMNAEWNSYPGVHPLISAPRSLDDYANSLATLVEYLTKTKNYSCIKYLCITNEPPGGPWGYWFSMGPEDAKYTPAIKRVHEEFVKRGIKTTLSGPDWTSLPPFNPDNFDFSPYLGAFDIHSYMGIDKKGSQTVKKWAEWAHSQNKPFFISEFGNMNLGWGTDNPGPKSHAAALSNARDMITALSLGTDAMNRWSFTNRSDLDGQWQLVRTYDRQKKAYLKTVIPENTAYYGFAMFTRFIAKYASVLQTTPGTGTDTAVSIISLRNPDGNLVFIMLNQSNETKKGEVALQSKLKVKVLYKYFYDEHVPAEGRFDLNPSEIKLASLKLNVTLEKKSITVYSTKKLANTDWGIIN